ncbi:MAG: YiiX/YebB-like N1pC/P60 family cysteine hydrolase [Halobacteriovoraceae bacterium]|nr:YiiX/YebB-like N1pC/P60 family cysteine hydrolase [Halobacteriovoraceae bacterium]
MAQGSFSLEKSEEHLIALNSLGLEKVDRRAQLGQSLEDLRRIELYSQSLAQFILNSLDNKKLSPYSLNLVSATLEATGRVHSKIQSYPVTKEHEMLKALQLESFKKVHDLFFHKKSLRGIVADQISTHGLSQFESVKDKSFNKHYIEGRYQYLKRNAFPIKETGHGLENSWKQSGLYKLLERSKNWDDLADTGMFWRNVGDGILGGLGKVTTGASAAFGAVAGNIAWREGYLKNNTRLLNTLYENLKPFDLLMEKKAYKFTDITIPGHWGHVGIYLGTENQLREMGLWDTAEMKPFQEGISNGKTIFQVRRWGLEFDSLENFSNLDEIAVLRVKGFVTKSENSLKQSLKFLSEQMGKGYDFSFDAMTGETITCTEIVAFSYGPIRWPMETILGRLTISPNDMARLAFYNNSPLQTVYYFTGNERGMISHSEEDFGKTLNFVKKGGRYKLHTEKCERTRYRHRSGGMRFQYSCEDFYNEMNY